MGTRACVRLATMSSLRAADRRSHARVLAIAAAAALATAGPVATAGPTAALANPAALVQPRAPTPSAPVAQCTVRDDRLAELSGLAADAEFRYATSDGGRRLQVIVLRKDCTVQRVITAAVDPFDIEDLALGSDGRLWLADIGDNDRRRETVALHVLAPTGAPTLHRLTYPDGPHDAEALLMDRNGTPYLVTKETLGDSGVYRPVGPMATPGPTPLELVTRVRLGRTDTPGGPVGPIGSTLVTGGASSADGSVVALRTYTDAYLFAVPDGDLVAALGRQPVRVPLPNEPQGEAIAFEPYGALLSASERRDAGPQPIRAVPGAAALVTASNSASNPASNAEPSSGTPNPAPPGSAPSAQPAGTSQPGRGPLADWQAVLIAVLGAAAVIIVIRRVVRR